LPSHSTEKVRQSVSSPQVAGPVSVADSLAVSAGASGGASPPVPVSEVLESPDVESPPVALSVVVAESPPGEESVFAESPPVAVSPVVDESVPLEDEPSSLPLQATRQRERVEARRKKREERMPQA
jgi:hypothetical protein